MSQNLTQPEEIDRVLKEMAGLEIQEGMAMLDEAQSTGAIRGLGCGEPIGVMGFSHGAVYKKLIQSA